METILDRLKSNYEDAVCSKKLRLASFVGAKQVLLKEEKNLKEIRKRASVEIRAQQDCVRRAIRARNYCQRITREAKDKERIALDRWKNYETRSRYKVKKNPRIAFDAIFGKNNDAH